jgi:hypothetical protein
MIILAQFENERSLFSSYQQQAFQVNSNEYFKGISFEQTGLNSDGNDIFCLSLIEIYGELKHQ